MRVEGAADLAAPAGRLTAGARSVRRAPARLRVLLRRIGRRRGARFSAQSGARVEAALDRAAVRQALDELTYLPLVSVVTPVHETDPDWLRRAVESVRGQSYPHWQLCLADDGSTNEATRAVLDALAGDARFVVTASRTNTGIAAATNRALASATGEFVAFLDHDDELDSEALLECVRLLNLKPETDVVYTDEDKLDRRGRRRDPFFKPDWSPELFRGVMYVGHLLVIRRTLVEEAGWLESRFDGVQDYELMLRVSERTERIEHVPEVLYHWRRHRGSLARSGDAKDGIPELQAAAVDAHLERCGIPERARPHARLPHRAVLTPTRRTDWPAVTVIVPATDRPLLLERCLASVFERSSYPRLAVRVVVSGTETPAPTERRPLEVVRLEGPWNLSRAQNAGAAGGADVVVFVGAGCEVQTPEWLETLVSLLERDGVGAVGPLLVSRNGTVQHAGVVLGLGGAAGHVMRGLPGDADGYAGSLSCTREVSAVTAACLAVRRDVLLEAGGFDEHFVTRDGDVDLCLRLRAAGRRNLFTPRAVLRNDERTGSGEGDDPLDRALLLDRWGTTIRRGDPYYSPRLSLSGADYRPRSAA